MVSITPYQHRRSAWLFGALLVGGFLRLFQIGRDVFWFDELNVLQVVNRTTLWEAIHLTHEHVMAMPLHYAMVWLVGKVFQGEGWMRLPEALWGTSAILLSDLIARHYLNDRQAIISTWIVATSPLLIMYSQELRFYSGLVFFYLLTTLIGIQAVETNRLRYWGLFCFIGVLGLAFHVYVLLSLSIVYAYFLSNPPGHAERRALKGLVRSTIVLLLALLGLLLAFGRAPKESWTLQFDLGLVLITLQGIGWAPPFPVSPSGWLYYSALLVFGMIGLFTPSDRLTLKRSRFLLLALLAQIVTVIFSNWVGKYFLAPRQLLFLVPFFGFYPAIGLERVCQALLNHPRASKFSLRQLTLGVLLLSLSLLTILTLEQYYRLEKGIVKEALPHLQREWRQGDLICVVPEADAVTYAYYWRHQFGASVLPCSNLEVEKETKVRFILSPPGWTPPPHYQLFFQPHRPSLYERWIWKRSQ